MAEIIIIGDGPAGLSAALFLSKAKHNVTVFGKDQTPMHSAMLYNYLGIPEIKGPDFQTISRQQVTDFGTNLVFNEAASVKHSATGFTVTSDEPKDYEAQYLIIASGKNPEFAKKLGLTLDERKSIAADRDGRTTVENCYVVGWSTRPDKIQAIISAGDGASAALDILSKEAGKEIHDFDYLE